MKKVLYKTHATSVGLGRAGSTISLSYNRNLIKIGFPKELGGTGVDLNPEHLFASAYAACLQGAIVHTVQLKQVGKNPEFVDVAAILGTRDETGFTINLEITVKFKDLDLKIAEELVRIAHEEICPYSYILKGGNANIKVKVLVD